jgi:site-specific DNA-methyltransferase (adenine-specific)
MRLILGDSLERLKGLEDNSVDSIVTDPPYGLSFMGKKWDYDVPSQEIWEECLRVLKPGGYLLAFAGTRTQHRMAVRIEDAGFEIRDMIAWVYGSGFPKSHNIGKAVDKLQGNKREVVGEQKLMGTARRMKGGNYGDFGGEDTADVVNLTKGNSPYEGYGTALKPALEPITVARKPLSEKTVAQNVLKYGTGGINIDGCRVENTGRFPANLIHDGSDEVVKLFPETGGGKFSKQTRSRKGFMLSGSEDNIQEANAPDNYGDSGSASRFFYCAKASKSERNRGCEEFEEKPLAFSNQAKAELKRGNTNFNGGDAKGHGNKIRHIKNHHPTVKPISLMRYLCRLVTPKGGTVLDPFMGSGTTGIGAKLEGFDFIGIEREEEYIKIAEARINAWQKENKLL